MLLLDAEMPLSWDYQHSSIYNMNLNIKDKPEQVKQRWNILFAAHVFDYDYRENVDFIQFVEKIVTWVNEYPKQFTLSQGMNEQKNIVSIDSSFLS